MSAALMGRATRLAVAALWRETGLFAAALGLAGVAFACLQEPRFFRTSGDQLAWSSVFCSADILSLLFCLSSFLPDRTSTAMRLIRAFGCLLAASGLLLFLVTATCVADAAIRSPTPWDAMPDMVVRFVLVWTPICVLAQLPHLRGGAAVNRFALLTVAFFVQCGVHRASLPGGTAGHQVLSSVLATAGCLLALGGGRQ